MSICGARTRQATPCQSSPMPNGRCRLHGGKSLSGAAHGRYKTGAYTREAKTFQQAVRMIGKLAQQVTANNDVDMEKLRLLRETFDFVMSRPLRLSRQ